LPQSGRLDGDRLAFPHDEDAPAEPAEGPLHPFVTGRIAVNLGDPIVSPGCGDAAPAAGGAVPEAAGGYWVFPLSAVGLGDSSPVIADTMPCAIAAESAEGVCVSGLGCLLWAQPRDGG
jgi:hypothetical protein